MKTEIESSGHPKFTIQNHSLKPLKANIFQLEITLSQEVKNDPTCQIITDAISGRRFMSISFSDESGNKLAAIFTTEKKDELPIFTAKIFALKSEPKVHRFLFLPEKIFRVKKDTVKKGVNKEGSPSKKPTSNKEISQAV